MESSWAEFRTYASVIEAELDKGLLEEAEMPVVITSPVSGIFGSGFIGSSVHGVQLLVPAALLEEAATVAPAPDE